MELNDRMVRIGSNGVARTLYPNDRKDKMDMQHLPQLKNPKPSNAVQDVQTTDSGVRAVVTSKLKMVGD